MIATDTVRTETISTYDSGYVEEKQKVETTPEDKADNSEQQDSLELYDEPEPLISENYNNLRYIPIMPASIFGNEYYGPKVRSEIVQFMKEFCSGNATVEELQQRAGMAGQDTDEECFSFFYKEHANPFIPGVNTLETQMGILLIRLGVQSWKIDVPFNNSTVLGKLASQFNAQNLFEKSNATGNPVLMRWLSRFTIFTRVRGHERIREEILGK